MKIVACWSPGYALKLRSWLMDHRALHYTSGLEGLIMAPLNSPDPPVELAFIFTRHLLIPFDGGAGSLLGRLLASKAHRVLAGTKATDLVESLVHAVDTKAFPSDRTDWYRGIAEGLKEAEVPTDWLKVRIPTGKKDDGVTRPLIHLSSGESLTETEEDVRLRCLSYEELLALLKSTARSEHFYWERALEAIVEHLTVEQVSILQSELERFAPGPAVSAIFAARLAALGQGEEAKALACEVLKDSSPSGWSRWYDGGTRLSAAKCLIAVHGESGRKQAHELLVDDYFSGRFPSMILHSLDELVEILFDVPPIADIWEELEKHIYQLAEFSEAKEFPSHSHIESELSHGAMLIRLLFADLVIPVPELREEIHKAICELALASIEGAVISEQIRTLLTKSEDSQFQAMALLESIKQFLSEVPHWTLYCLGWAHAIFHRAIREQGYGAKRHAGTIDLSCAAYLPSCDRFVTDDNAQRRALKVINVYNPRKTCIVSYDELRKRLLVA